MVFTLSTTAFATTEYAESTKQEVVSYVSEVGQEQSLLFTTAPNGILTITQMDKNGILIAKSTLYPAENKVIQEVADGVSDGTVYDLNRIVEKIGPATNLNPGSELEYGLLGATRSLSDPPVLDTGLSNSSVFSGYKNLGSVYNNIYGVTCAVHRHIDSNEAGEAYRFTISAGATVATIAGILLGVATGGTLLAASATALATAFLGAGVDTLVQGELSFIKLHYTFKYNCNGSSNYSYKNCSCEEWWQIYRNGTLKGYELKNGSADGHMGANIPMTCQDVIQMYLNGEAYDVSCSDAYN